MSRTFHLTLRSPKGNSQVWVLRGPGVNDEDPEWPSSLTHEQIKRLGWDSKRERGLSLVDNSEGTPAAEVRAVHSALYNLHQVAEIFQEGDRIIMPASTVRRWHSYEEDAPTFRSPKAVFYAQSFHILKEGEESSPKANPRSAVAAKLTASQTRLLTAMQQGDGTSWLADQGAGTLTGGAWWRVMAALKQKGLVEQIRNRDGLAPGFKLCAKKTNPRSAALPRHSTNIQTVLIAKTTSLAKAKAWLKRAGFRCGKVDAGSETAAYWRFRQHAPEDYQDGSLRTIALADDVKAVTGVPKQRSAASKAPGYGARGPRGARKANPVMPGWRAGLPPLTWTKYPNENAWAGGDAPPGRYAPFEGAPFLIIQRPPSTKPYPLPTDKTPYEVRKQGNHGSHVIGRTSTLAAAKDVARYNQGAEASQFVRLPMDRSAIAKKRGKRTRRKA